MTLHDMARIKIATGKLPEAIKLCDEGINTIQQSGELDAYYLQAVQIVKAHALNELNEFDEAYTILSKIFSIQSSNADGMEKELKLMGLMQLGSAQMGLHAREAAASTWQKALEIAQNDNPSAQIKDSIPRLKTMIARAKRGY